jgi:hypothetical protein
MSQNKNNSGQTWSGQEEKIKTEQDPREISTGLTRLKNNLAA